MGQMKEFAARLSHMVYERRWTDKQIVEALESQKYDSLWVRQQIRIVRSNPQIYKAMGGTK